MLEAIAKRRQPKAGERLVAASLAAGRALIGAAFWFTPDLAARTMGFDRVDEGTRAIARIAGTRDLILAGWALESLDDRERLRRASIAVAVADAGDTVAFALLLRSREGPRGAALRGLAGAFPATVAGLWLVDSLRR